MGRAVKRIEPGPAPARAEVHPRATPARTIPVPLVVEIPADQMTIHAAPPGLITRRNADYLGLTGDELMRMLRAMRADPRFRDRVIVHGKSYRAAAPDDLIAFLRAAPTTTPASEDAEDDEDAVDAVLREGGYRLKPGARAGR
jgi:hypothetical protein